MSKAFIAIGVIVLILVIWFIYHQSVKEHYGLQYYPENYYETAFGQLVAYPDSFFPAWPYRRSYYAYPSSTSAYRRPFRW